MSFIKPEPRRPLATAIDKRVAVLAPAEFKLAMTLIVDILSDVFEEAVSSGELRTSIHVETVASQLGLDLKDGDARLAFREEHDNVNA